jgi:hypothetical protein
VLYINPSASLGNMVTTAFWLIAKASRSIDHPMAAVSLTANYRFL